ncbi:MAG: hypothetical protein KKF68_00485 [Nanoarchaeota archaeon]|nr:hypothetical protein [Nanoarchaeota archaeon]
MGGGTGTGKGELSSAFKEDEEYCPYSPSRLGTAGAVLYTPCQTCRNRNYELCSIFQEIEKEIPDFEASLKKRRIE